MARLSNRIILLFLFSFLAACSGNKKKGEPFADATVEEIYQSARQNLEDNNWKTAIEELRILESRSPYGDYAEQAQLDTAYAYHKSDKPELAIAAADRFLRLYPTHESAAYAWYIKGLANFNEKVGLFATLSGLDDLSDRDPEVALKALEAFKEVYTKYPDSRYASDARRRAVHLNNSLARHEVQVAKHYYAKQAYVAVLGRTRKVVEEFQFSPVVEDALGLMMLTYREMKLSDLESDTRRILEKNYPQSKYLSATRDSILGESEDGASDDDEDASKAKKSKSKFNFFKFLKKRNKAEKEVDIKKEGGQ